jgi:hypothetical protein
MIALNMDGKVQKIELMRRAGDLSSRLFDQGYSKMGRNS